MFAFPLNCELNFEGAKKMIGKYKIKEFDSGDNWIHAHGCFDDHTLCGEDIAGDYDREIKKVAKGKINCPRCIKIINYCKKIIATEQI